VHNDPAAHVTLTVVPAVFGVQVAPVSIQYNVPESPTPVSAGVRVTVTLFFPDAIGALSVVIGAVAS